MFYGCNMKFLIWDICWYNSITFAFNDLNCFWWLVVKKRGSLGCSESNGTIDPLPFKLKKTSFALFFWDISIACVKTHNSWLLKFFLLVTISYMSNWACRYNFRWMHSQESGNVLGSIRLFCRLSVLIEFRAKRLNFKTVGLALSSFLGVPDERKPDQYEPAAPLVIYFIYHYLGSMLSTFFFGKILGQRE